MESHSRVNSIILGRSPSLLFLTFSVLVANPKKLLYTVANPARGLLNREKKKKKEKVWQRTNVPVRETLLTCMGETNWPVAPNCGFKHHLTSKTHTERRQPRSMAEGLGAGGVEKYMGFSPLDVPTTNAASPKLPLGSLVSNTPTTATPSRRTLTEGLS